MSSSYIGIGTTAKVSSETTASQVQIQSALGLSTSTSSTKLGRIKQTLIDDISSKKRQRSEISDILLLLDIDLDMYDELIINIDKQVPSLLQEINDAIQDVDDAYTARITGDGRSDLHWAVESTQTVEQELGGEVTTTVYKCTKNNTRQQINRYAAKYYKRPKDRDYGASAVKEIPSANVGIGSTYMVINDPTTTGDGTTYTALSGIQIDDTITDAIEQPTVFTLGSLPEVVGFGTTATLGIKTTFGGSLAFGSTIIAYTGFNTTADVSIGDRIWRTGVTSTDSVVTGFGTTTVSITGIGTTGESVTFSINTTAIYLDKVSVASTDQAIFNVGIFTTYPTIFISDTSLSGAENENFYVIRNSGADENFNPTTSGENPIEIGTINIAGKTGFGHSIFLVNNGDPQRVKAFTEYVDPEPKVGGGYVEYWEGNFAWPGINVPILGGIGGTSIIGYTFTYSNEGDTQSVLTGVGVTAGSSSAIAYAGVGPSNPSQATKNAQDAAIVAAEAALDAIKDKNIPILNDLITKSRTLRRKRNEKQSQAWAYRRGRGSINNDIIQAQKDLTELNKTDLSQYE